MNPCPFDLSGNTQSDGANAYTYDAESQIKTAAGVIYLYDGSGRRVSKSSGKLYWYGSGGEILGQPSSATARKNNASSVSSTTRKTGFCLRTSTGII